MKNEIRLSTLSHTWILDLDGTIVKHNGYQLDGEDSFLEGAKEFLQSIPDTDMIIFLTSRTKEQREITIKFLKKNKVRFDHIIFQAPYGERILINDDKPSGLSMAKCLPVRRDGEISYHIVLDEKL
jgi:ribonucleotide monophosphatase NagD (HAD superfamily)